MIEVLIVYALWVLLVAHQQMRVFRCERIPPPAPELLARSGQEVECYVDDLRGRTGRPAVLAQAVWAFGRRCIVFDRAALETLASWQLAYVVAHELGHHHHGHPRRSAIAMLVGLPFLTYPYARGEVEADAYAEALSGLKREVLVW